MPILKLAAAAYSPREIFIGKLCKFSTRKILIEIQSHAELGKEEWRGILANSFFSRVRNQFLHGEGGRGGEGGRSLQGIISVKSEKNLSAVFVKYFM